MVLGHTETRDAVARSGVENDCWANWFSRHNALEILELFVAMLRASRGTSGLAIFAMGSGLAGSLWLQRSVRAHRKLRNVS